MGRTGFPQATCIILASSAFLLRFFKTPQKVLVRGTPNTPCKKCLESYKNSPNYIVKRLDPFAKAKDKCDKCQSYGYDYLVIERSKEG